MKFFISQMANGSVVVARKKMVAPHRVQQVELDEQAVDGDHRVPGHPARQLRARRDRAGRRGRIAV
jgi:hypothetical protein